MRRGFQNSVSGVRLIHVHAPGIDPMTDTTAPQRHGPEGWRPLTGMPEGAHAWGVPGYAAMAEEWTDIRERLKDRAEPKAFVDLWLVERARAFAIETGQIEGLYTMRRGITLQLMAEGLEGVLGAHTVEGLDDRTIRGLLADQEAALRMVFSDMVEGRPLTLHMIKTWHQLLTRHQETVTGLTPDGRKVQVRFTEKGRWKDRPNNPRRRDGLVHQYCPPEQVQQEMDRFIELYGEISEAGYPTEVEAAWMHHRFVRTHPFRDGNGRVSRLLMAHAYLRRGEPPPVVSHEIRPSYIDALEAADEGDLRAFSDFLGYVAIVTLRSAIQLGRRALSGNLSRSNGNGGRTIGTTYYPPLGGANEELPLIEDDEPVVSEE